MSIARSGIAWFLAKVVALSSSWLAAMYFTRALADPAQTLGQFYVFETVVTFLMLTTNGGVNAAIRKRVSEGDEPERYAGAGVLVSAVLVVGATVLVVLVSPLVMDFFGLGGLTVLFIAGMVWALQTRNTVTAILEGYSKVGRSGAIGMFDTASRVVFQVVLITLGFGLVGMMGGALAGVSITSIIAVAVLGAGLKMPSRKHVANLLSYAKYAFLTGFTTKFYDNIDIVVITAFLSSSATGIYGIGFRFSLILNVFSGAISTSSLPEISYYSAQDNEERVKEILADAVVFSTVLAIPAVAGMIVIAEPLIVTFYTGSFRAAADIATIAVAIQVPDGLRSIFSTTMHAIDRPDLTFRSGVILIVTNAILDLALVPTVGVIGAVVASFVGITLATLYLGYHLFEQLDLSWHVLPFRSLLAELFAASFMGIFVYVVKQNLTLPVIPLLVVLVLLGVTTYFAILLIISAGIRQRCYGIAQDVVP